MRNPRVERRQVLCGRAITAAGAALALGASLAGLAVAASAPREGELIVSLSDGDSTERRSTLPVTREREANPSVVLSQPVRASGGLRRGDVIRAAAELQLTTTCVDGSMRCIGREYMFSPRMDARVVLAASPSATGGRRADPISGLQTKRCNQQRPNRNHHCVLVFSDVAKRVRNVRSLPCPPAECFVNVIASADHHAARPGNVVIVGADRPDGSIAQDKARLAVLVERGRVPAPRVYTDARAVRESVPIAPEEKAGRRVTFSLELDDLRKGDVLVAKGQASLSIASLPYNAFVGTRMIVASSPRAVTTSGYAALATTNGGEISELNGFNCTHGPSAYKDPCTTRKSAIAMIRRSPPTRRGKPKPLYLNLVVAGAPKLAPASDHDRMRVLGGSLRAERYRAP